MRRDIVSQVEMAKATDQLVSEADYVQLSRLVIEHGWRADHGRADTLHELYVEDGELDVGTPLRGRKAIRDWGRQLVESPPWRTIRHVCGNMRFVTDGPNAAMGTTVLTVFMVAGEGTGTTVPFNVGEDHDRFVRTEEGWKFASRRWVDLFARGDALNLP
jgi:SnoaL-like domain